MASSRPPTADQLACVAEARASGLSWPAAAKLVHRRESTVRQWPRAYPKPWLAALRRAERQLVRDATAESVHTLRKQLRSEDEKAGREAARHLMQFQATLRRQATRRTKQPPALTATPQTLEGWTDAELWALLRELVEHGPDAGPTDSPSAADVGSAVPEPLP